MEMTGEYTIPASREKVWDALNDPEVLKACIPGAKSLEKVSNTEMKAKVEAKVGPVKAAFEGRMTLSNINPPNSCTISGESKGGPAGFVKGGADVTLAEDGPQSTKLTYAAKAQVGGKLAQIGARLIDSTAKHMADQFFGRFVEAVGTPAPVDEKGEEAVLADVINDPEVTAEAVEERLEIAAGRGVMGGPYVWGLLALLAVIALILIFQ